MNHRQANERTENYVLCPRSSQPGGRDIDPHKLRRVFSSVFMLSMLVLVGCSADQSPPPAPQKTTVPWLNGDWFLLGVNYPWIHYGHDFGECAWGHDGVSTEESRKQLKADFAEMKRQGVHVVRWFLFGDGRASPEFDSDGFTTGLDQQFYRDLDVALAIAEEHDIYLIIVLLDFHLAKKAENVKGVQTGGRSELITHAGKRKAFLEKALKPLLQKYGNHKNIIAWDVINEPEGAMDIPGGRWVEEPVSAEAMQSFVKDAVRHIHKDATQHATLGSASRRWLDYWRGCNLDFYQYHYYDKMESEWSLEYPCAQLRLDKPCIVGEFPTKNSRISLQKHLDIIHEQGYGGALAWSYRAEDDESDFGSCREALGRWSREHEPLVNIKPKQ